MDLKKSVRSIKDLFWESAEEAVSEPGSSSPSTQPVSSAAAGIDAKIYERLCKSLEEANLPGFDYLEFRDSVKEMEATIAEESVRYKTAYIMAKKINVSSEKLAETAGHYIDVLKKEKEVFGKALNEKINEEITQKENRLKQIDIQVKENIAAIQKLTDENKKMEAEKIKMSDGANEAKQRIQTSRESFAATYDHIVASINDDIKKIKKYLGA